jgi:CBS domain-containing protein
MSNVTAADVMTRDVATLRETQTIGDLLKQLRVQLSSGVPVVDAGGRAVGLISQNDVARALALAAGAGEDDKSAGTGERTTAGALVDEALTATPGKAPGLAHLLPRPVKDIMTPVVWSCRPTADLADVCDMMVQRRIHRVVVCDESRRVLGMVSALDVVRLFKARLSAE